MALGTVGEICLLCGNHSLAQVLLTSELDGLNIAAALRGEERQGSAP